MPELPPWLDVTPAQFGQAAAEGARVNLERAHLQQSAAQAAAQLGMESQRLAAAEQQNAREAQLNREKIARDFQLSQTKLAVADAYNQSKLGLARNALDFKDKVFKQAVENKNKEISDTVGLAKHLAGGGSALEGRALYPSAKLPAGEEKSAPQETIERKTTYDAVPGTDPVAAKAARGSLLWGLIGPRPATPAMPGTPAIAGGTTTESVKVPPGTTPAAAFAAATPGSAGTPPASGTAPLALPKTKDELQEGKTYQTARGPAVWDGENFTAQ